MSELLSVRPIAKHDAARLRTRREQMREPTESILEDKRNNTVYTAVAFRRLTYDEMLAVVRRLYRLWHPERRTWLKDHRIRIHTDIGLED